jgi:hypothetical protein
MHQRDPLPCSHFILCYGKRIKFALTTHLLMIQFNIIVKATPILWKLNIPFHYPIPGFCICLYVVCHLRLILRQISLYPGCNQQHSVFLLLDSDGWPADNWLSTFRIKRVNISSNGKIFLTFWPLNVRPHHCLEISGTDEQVTSRRKPL